MNLLFDFEDEAVPNIAGLIYFPDFISEEEERALLDKIDGQPWLTDLKRRVQHYGYKYDYKARNVDKGLCLGALPKWLTPIADKLESNPSQAIVNEYLPGQGISAHVDCVPCFDGTIASLSLGAGTTMVFARKGHRQEMYLEPRSLLMLSGEARYDWTHAIPARKNDVIEGVKVERKRRVSVTFRTVITND